MTAEWATPKAIERVHSMRAEGASASVIGARLGVSKGCISGMLDRLKVPSPNPPVHRPGACYGPKPKPPTKTKPQPLPRAPATLPPLVSALAKPRAAPVPPRRAIPAPIPPPAARPVIAAPAPLPKPDPTPRASAGECCWPISDRPYRYCDAPTFGRLPYCDAHAKRAYQSEGWRHRQTAVQTAHAGGEG